jgi:hypothetical protein
MKMIGAFLTLIISVLSADITWPEDQVLPWFAEPADELDAVSVAGLSADARLTLVALQGLVNREQPRLFLHDPRSEEGVETWPKSLHFGPRTLFSSTDILKKHSGVARGLVLYDPSRSSHYRNLAATAASIENALPVTKEMRSQLIEIGHDLEVLIDLTSLNFTSPLEIYRHLRHEYWPRCQKRLLFSLSPSSQRGHHHHIRDLAAATTAATLWLDCRRPEERELMKQFLADLTVGQSVILGWHPTERSGITTASAFGISTIPADFFQNSTLTAAGDHRIEVPKTTPPPVLADKVYLSLFISDGDNIQYNQHAMRRVWDEQMTFRGKIPLNWTISPALVDLAPGILNYYYRTGTPLDCFVAGPSGLGYLMPVNTLQEPGAEIGPVLTDPARTMAFARLTETYLKRSGLRVLTIWDNASPLHRRILAEHCPSLLGATVQNFRDMPSVKSSNEDGLAFEKLVVPYTTTAEHLTRSITRELQRKKVGKPLFLPYQINIWKELKPELLTQVLAKLQEAHPEIEVIRADHYFQLLRRSRNQ